MLPWVALISISLGLILAMLVFAGTKALKFNLQEVDLVGDADLALHFRTEDSNLNG